MVDRVLIDSTSIRVSKPGINVNTASLDNLLLTIDARVGQILASGYQALGEPFLDPEHNNYSSRAATIVYGPFSRAPDILLYVYADDGYAYPSASTFVGGGNSISYAANYDNFFTVTECTIGVSSTYIKGYMNPWSVLPVSPVGIYYVIYRKPSRS